MQLLKVQAADKSLIKVMEGTERADISWQSGIFILREEQTYVCGKRHQERPATAA